MAEPKFAQDGKLGVDLDSADTTQRHALGTVSRGAANNVYIYCFANEALVSGSGAELGASFTASATAGGELTTIYAIASGEFGWVERTDITIQS
jgi:hypothetical protein